MVSWRHGVPAGCGFCVVVSDFKEATQNTLEWPRIHLIISCWGRLPKEASYSDDGFILDCELFIYFKIFKLKETFTQPWKAVVEVISDHSLLVKAHSLITENTNEGKPPSSDNIWGRTPTPAPINTKQSASNEAEAPQSLLSPNLSWATAWLNHIHTVKNKTKHWNTVIDKSWKNRTHPSLVLWFYMSGQNKNELGFNRFLNYFNLTLIVQKCTKYSTLALPNWKRCMPLWRCVAFIRVTTFIKTGVVSFCSYRCVITRHQGRKPDHKWKIFKTAARLPIPTNSLWGQMVQRSKNLWKTPELHFRSFRAQLSGLKKKN